MATNKNQSAYNWLQLQFNQNNFPINSFDLKTQNIPIDKNELELFRSMGREWTLEECRSQFYSTKSNRMSSKSRNLNGKERTLLDAKTSDSVETLIELEKARKSTSNSMKNDARLKQGSRLNCPVPGNSDMRANCDTGSNSDAKSTVPSQATVQNQKHQKKPLNRLMSLSQPASSSSSSNSALGTALTHDRLNQVDPSSADSSVTTASSSSIHRQLNAIMTLFDDDQEDMEQQGNGEQGVGVHGSGNTNVHGSGNMPSSPTMSQQQQQQQDDQTCTLVLATSSQNAQGLRSMNAKDDDLPMPVQKLLFQPVCTLFDDE